MKKTFKNILDEIKIFAIDNIKSGTSKTYFSDKFYYFINELKKVNGIEMDSMDSITTFYGKEDVTISFYDELLNGGIKEIKIDFGVNEDLTDFSVEKYFG